MEIKLLSKNEQSNWDQFVESHPLGSIFQSTAWAKFQEQTPQRGKYWILAIYENNKIVGGSLLIRHKLPAGLSWIYASRGPLLDYKNKEKSQKQIIALTTHIKTLVKNEKALFLRIDPPILDQESQELNFKNFKEIKHGFQPQHTLVLDLTQSEETLLEQMKPKGRYNIRLAEKKGVKVEKMGSENIEVFYKLLKETTDRDGFSGHNINYYKAMLSALTKNKNAALYIATFNDKPISAIIATFFADTAIYYYGASSNEHRNLMAPYLLQWQVIKEAKSQGYKQYDFLGISPQNQPKHAWAGVTEFKLKFGGERIDYAQPRETALRPFLYFLYKIYKKLRSH